MLYRNVNYNVKDVERQQKGTFGPADLEACPGGKQKQQSGQKQEHKVNVVDACQRKRGYGCAASKNQENVEDVAAHNIAESEPHFLSDCGYNAGGKFRKAGSYRDNR